MEFCRCGTCGPCRHYESNPRTKDLRSDLARATADLVALQRERDAVNVCALLAVQDRRLHERERNVAERESERLAAQVEELQAALRDVVPYVYFEDDGGWIDEKHRSVVANAWSVLDHPITRPAYREKTADNLAEMVRVHCENCRCCQRSYTSTDCIHDRELKNALQAFEAARRPL